MIATNIVRQYEAGQLQRRDASAIIEWEEVLERLSPGLQAWLTVAGSDGVPSVRPVLAVLADGALHTTSSASARKTRLLEAGTAAALATSAGGLDVVWSGHPRRVADEEALERVAAAFRDGHGWEVERAGAALDAPYGAPSAGPPPYLAFRIQPRTVYAFGTVDGLAERSTRWDVAPNGENPTLLGGVRQGERS